MWNHSMKAKEPYSLRQGKAFHKKLQADWLGTAEGRILTEKAITKSTGRKGRIDIFVDDDGGKLVAVVEVKNSNWDKMTEKAVSRNVRRQVKQIWDYIDSQLAKVKEVSPGIIFPHRPKDKARMELIEHMFEQEGIPVVWQDETMEERKERSET
jgi:Holliday junction resolvase-like predicted endonuclease